MDMVINGELVRLLRTQRAWSQEELATACGLSLRTVQRIENTGSCSLESKKALVAVFEIESGVLEIDKQTMIAAVNNRKGKIYGYAGVLMGLLSAYAAITYSVLTNGIPAAEAGMAYGITGAFCGICAAFIGVSARRID